MSFLNPISEPVLMFSSTDDQAPKINYAARAAGDVKTVLKACLVTGYGSKASAGWSMQNETDFDAEFVSPSVAMSDYSLGVSDNQDTMTWYYNYKGGRTTPQYGTIYKSINIADLNHADNGWRLIVSKRGVVFIELVQHRAVNKLSARLTYIGAVKSALIDKNGINIAFFNIGHSARDAEPIAFYSNTYPHIRVDNYSAMRFVSVAPLSTNTYDLAPNISTVDMIGSVYLVNNDPVFFVGELPGMLAKIVNDETKIYGVSTDTVNNRPVLKVCLGYLDDRLQYAYSRARVMLIYLDSWSY